MQDRFYVEFVRLISCSPHVSVSDGAETLAATRQSARQVKNGVAVKLFLWT